MLSLKTLRVLNRMPTAYREALDRRCRAASGYTGKRPGCDELAAWAGEAVEAERLARRLAALARIPGPGPAQRCAVVAAQLVASEQRRDYYTAYAAVAGAILRHIDPKLIPLMAGVPQDLLAAGRRRAEDYRFLLLQDQLDSAPVEIDDDGETRLAGIDELFALTGTRRHVRRLRRDAGMAALHLGCLLGQVGKVGNDDYQLYAPDVLVSVSREQNRRTLEWAKGHRLVERQPGERPLSLPLAEVLQNQLAARHATLWSLIKAVEQHAEGAGLACLFVTFTLPPEYHPNPSHGAGSWDPALSPVRGAEELQERWHRMLARSRKAGMPVLGLWTLEPHRDGAPHRHAMIWLRPEHQARFLGIVRDEFPDPEDQENVAAAVKSWQQRPAGTEGAASPATYIVKYILKTFLGGEQFVDAAEQPDPELRHLENPERVQAWRRGLGGKRMYDFFGLKRGAVTIWDRIAKIPEDPEVQSDADRDTLADPVFGAAHRAIKERRGADALAVLELVVNGLGAVAVADASDAMPGPAVEILRGPVVDGEGRSVVRAVAIMSRSNGVIDLSPQFVVVPNLPAEPGEAAGEAAFSP